jgi:hypothetical protein
MKEFEAGNYDALYVTVQPGVLTINTNIIGFKAYYFLRDRLGFFENQTEMQRDLTLHTFSKVPKSIVILVLLLVATLLVKRAFNFNASLVFLTLMGLEPFVLGNSRVIQTDIIPAYLVFISALLYYLKGDEKSLYRYGTIGFLLGLSNIEKASSVIALPIFLLIFVMNEKTLRRKVSSVLLFLVVFFFTMIAFFPAFWGNFSFTLWRIFVGSFIQGVKGLDAETFTYEVTRHIRPGYFYIRFLYNQLSEFVLVGLLIFLATIFKTNRASRDTFLPKLKKYLPMLLIPIVFLIMFQLSNKKVERFMLFTFPFIILYASIGYERLIRKAVWLYILLGFVLTLRLIQFTLIFPDFLIYRNPLSIDRTYNARYLSWGIGYWKLSNYLQSEYGSGRTIHLGDYENLKLFYDGEVKNFDDSSCDDSFDLVVQTNEIPSNTCFSNKLLFDKEFKPYKNVVFYIYESDNTSNNPI